jgi:hypothetical protein
MTFKAHKTVATLPSILDPDTIYLVRVGTGFDFYCSDSTGTIAHKVNSSLESVNNISSGYIIDQSLTATAGSTYTIGAASTILFFPFSINNKNMRAASVNSVVSTANAAGRYRVAIYDSNLNSNTPKDLIWFSDEFTTIGAVNTSYTTASFKTAPGTYEVRNLNTMLFESTKQYWIAFLNIATGGVVRGVNNTALQPLGLLSLISGNYGTCLLKTGVSSFPELNPFSEGGYSLTAGALPSIRFLTTDV